MIMAMKPTHVVLIATGIMVALYLQAAMLFTLLFLEHFRHLYQLPAFVEMFVEFLGVPVSYCTETLADNAIFHTHFQCSSYGTAENSERWKLYVAFGCLAAILFRVRIAGWFRTTFA
jgi:hypothetical protein